MPCTLRLNKYQWGYLLIINEVAPLRYQALRSMTGAGSNLKLQYLIRSKPLIYAIALGINEISIILDEVHWHKFSKQLPSNCLH